MLRFYNEIIKKIFHNKYIYKNVISLGCFCNVAGELRRIELREKAYPFDWIISNFEDVLCLISNNFQNYLNPKYFECGIENEIFVVNNKKYKLIRFLHDFNGQSDISGQIDPVRQKYERRIKRFYEDIKKTLRKDFYNVKKNNNENASMQFLEKNLKLKRYLKKIKEKQDNA